MKWLEISEGHLYYVVEFKSIMIVICYYMEINIIL